MWGLDFLVCRPRLAHNCSVTILAQAFLAPAQDLALIAHSMASFPFQSSQQLLAVTTAMQGSKVVTTRMMFLLIGLTLQGCGNSQGRASSGPHYEPDIQPTTCTYDKAQECKDGFEALLKELTMDPNEPPSDPEVAIATLLISSCASGTQPAAK